MGHVRDLPQSATEIPASVKEEKWAQLGVNVERQFEPLYVVPKDKKKVVQQLKDALKDADELILATDEDREGESISWHLLQVLKPKVPTKRMVFHEITQEAIKKALKNCRDIDEQLVHAQETRRILDRLVGYTLSPLLWKKIAWGLSAGRVQSVAVRLLVTKERLRRAFRQGSYWDLKAVLEQAKASFDSRLVSLAGVKIATGSDFDPNTGQIIALRQVRLLNEVEARELQERLTDKTWTVTDLEERPLPANLLHRLRLRPYNRRQTGNCASRHAIRCGRLKVCTSRGILPICGQTPCICPLKRSRRHVAASSKSTVNNTSARNPASTPPKAKAHKKPTKPFAPLVVPSGLQKKRV